MSDRSDISDVLIRYTTALDTCDWELLDSCFTEDAVADYGKLGGRKEGWAAIRSAVAFVAGFDRTQHMLTNIVMTIDADEAQTSSYVHAQHVIGREVLTVGGAYYDRVVRTPAGWRIAHRRLDPVWQTGNSVLAAIAAARSGGQAPGGLPT